MNWSTWLGRSTGGVYESKEREYGLVNLAEGGRLVEYMKVRREYELVNLAGEVDCWMM